MAAAVLLSCSDARACELSLVTPATSALKNPVEAHVSLADDALVARFSVLAPTLNAKKASARMIIPTSSMLWNCL